SDEWVPVAQSVGTDDGTFHSAFSVMNGVLAYRPGGLARRQLVWVDRTGKAIGVLGMPDDASLASPELAPDGRRVAVSRAVQGNYDVWLIEVTQGIANRFTSECVTGLPAWSPRGSRIIASSSR